MWAFWTWIAMKSFLPAMPVMRCSRSCSVAVSRMTVPWADGSFVFLIWMGMPTSRTGKMASSCRTEAPMYESSRISSNVMRWMERGLSTMRGSAARKPETSVQFSYTPASRQRARIAPVMSPPPRWKSFNVPSTVDP